MTQQLFVVSLLLSLFCQTAVAESATQTTAVKEPRMTVDLGKDLVLHFPFNGNATDQSGKGNNGKAIATTATQNRFGKVNSALQFNGRSSEVVVSPPPKISRKGFTVSLWVKFDLPDSCTTWKDHGDGGSVLRDPIIGQDDGYAIRCFQLWLHGKLLVWQRMNEFSSAWTKNFEVQKDTWYHCLVTFDGKNHSLYLNGKLAMDPVAGVFKASTDEPLRIGSKGEDSWPQRAFFSGVLDEVRLYNRVLNTAEIDALFNDPN